MSPARPPRSLARLVGTAAVAVALAVGAVGCGGDQDISRADFEEKLLERTEGQVSEEVAICITDRVFEEFDEGARRTIVYAATEDELTEGTLATLRTINDECTAERAPAAPADTAPG